MRVGANEESAPEKIVRRLKEVRDKEGQQVVRPPSPSGQWAEVQSGLAVGELVVIEGASHLSEGRKVTYRLVQTEEAPETSATTQPANQSSEGSSTTREQKQPRDQQRRQPIRQAGLCHQIHQQGPRLCHIQRTAADRRTDSGALRAGQRRYGWR